MVVDRTSSNLRIADTSKDNVGPALWPLRTPQEWRNQFELLGKTKPPSNDNQLRLEC